MTMFPAPGQPGANPPVPQGRANSDQLEDDRGGGFARYPVVVWQSVGSFVEGVFVDYTNKAPNRDPVTKQQKSWTNPQTGEVKMSTQDILTLLVVGGQGLVAPVGAGRQDLKPIEPGMIVSVFVSGHNRYDPDRPQHYGMPWYQAKDVLGRPIFVGDLARIDFTAHLDKAWNGSPLGIWKKILGFQARPSGGTPQEVEWTERARAARANPPADRPAPGFRPVQSGPVPQTASAVQGPPTQGFAAPQVPQPAPPADPTSSLFA